MKGSEAKLINFMEGANFRYVIPVYQRKYDWKIENCRQLYNDLKKVVSEDRKSHFFGSIVSSVIPDGANILYQIIDGQQRLTTVTLLLLAISNLVKTGKVQSTEQKLDEQIMQRFIIAPWAPADDRIKLRPVKGDREALAKLFGPVEDYDKGSNLTINYNFFCDMILKEEVTVDELFSAIGKLEIISITLGSDDNPQLIFESLNSTGLALTEGDKIRNYVLMGQTPEDQDRFFNNYWTKIEKCTARDVSGFVRDYLSIKQQITPNINGVYQAFKQYADEAKLPMENLLQDLLKYARYFEMLLTCNADALKRSQDDSAYKKEEPVYRELNYCLYRMNRLEIVVTRPFFMEVLRLKQDNKLTINEVLKIFEITEIYLFRRNICEVPTNALNKIFLNLNKEILRYDNTADNYVSKFIYALLSKKESGRFPDDEEFGTALAEKQVYLMRGKYKAYMFERFENYGTVEVKDVYKHLENNEYSIEHIMPQTLTPSWIEELGPDYAEIHETWKHRLANLTLTGYNSSLSNSPFLEKRDAPKGGYANSGLRMTQKIAQKDTWGLPELEERSKEMVEYAKTIWAYPKTEFKPAEKEFESCSLDDEDYDLTGRDIIKYSYQNVEQPVTSWADMLERVVKFLHSKDKSVLSTLAYSQSSATDLVNYVSRDENKLRSAIKIDDGIYFEKGTSTSLKISILRRLFALYHLDPMDLVFYLRDAEQDKVTDESRFDLRKRYWAYALPIIQKQNAHRGTFSNCTPGTSNTLSGWFGLSGFCISCVANMDRCRIDFYLGNSDENRNKEAFDILFSHKNEIESKLGVELSWDRADENKASWICYHLDGVGITNESDWPRAAKFHAEWSNKICDAMLPYLYEKYGAGSTNDDKVEKLNMISFAIREWGKHKTEEGKIQMDPTKCNRTYSRFMTKEMSQILPNSNGRPSGWNTENHYFYEVVNRTGDSIYIQLSLSSKNASDEERAIFDRINDIAPSKFQKNDWQWRNPFRTDSVKFSKTATDEEIYSALDTALDDLIKKQNELIKNLETNSSNDK